MAFLHQLLPPEELAKLSEAEQDALASKLERDDCQRYDKESVAVVLTAISSRHYSDASRRLSRIRPAVLAAVESQHASERLVAHAADPRFDASPDLVVSRLRDVNSGAVGIQAVASGQPAQVRNIGAIANAFPPRSLDPAFARVCAQGDICKGVR
jgi:hypothetical protein